MNFSLKVAFVRTGIAFTAFIATTCGGVEENRLASSTSPYLRQHADNPVDWFEWGPEPLQKAAEENKPLIISIGYASCHWCHVMEEESFMDTAVARMMNENFVAIKIDREQRPDIDQIYIQAAQLVSGSAGWPLNAFALPDGKPFYAGTYFPKEQWMILLRQVKEAYAKEKEAVIKQADALTEGIGSYGVIEGPGADSARLDKDQFASLVDQLHASLDFRNGGQRSAPKFPMPVIWEFMLQHYFLTGDEESLNITTLTLNKMAAGAIYDQIGGGFARYATDSVWRVPHFEKMLYDNAQLVSLYAHAYQVTKNPLYLDVIRETLAFVKSELTDDEGGFYSSINADSEGVEGKYYSWTGDQMRAALGNSMDTLLLDYFSVSDSGNWEEGKNILYREIADGVFASRKGVTAEAWKKVLASGKEKLRQARSKRIPPSTDEKAITSWNALMLVAYLDAYRASADEDYLNEALRNAYFLQKNLARKEGGLWRSYSRGRGGIDAFLDDYALLSRAYINLYQVTFDRTWLDRARALADYAIAHFRDERTGMFYYTSDMADDLVVRKMEVTDEVIPSSNSVMSEVLMLLGDYYQDTTYSSQSAMMRRHISVERVDHAVAYFTNWARISEIAAWQPFEVAVVGNDALQKGFEMQQIYHPLAIFSGGTREDLPLLENKRVDGKTIIYVCRNRVCRMPVETADQAMEQMRNNK